MNNLPQWLISKDNYEPQKDKDAFIDKSILSILKVLSRLRGGTEVRKVRKIENPVIKLTLLLIFILTITLSHNFIFVVCMDSLALITISLFNERNIRHILKVTFGGMVFSLIILIPSIIMGNVNNSIMIVLKVGGTVSSVNIFSAVTQWNEASAALRSFFIPDIFIFVLDITIKYIALLGEFSVNMLLALKKRTVGITHNKAAHLSAIMGTMFIKSREMAEEMQGAMECRGFTGEYKQPLKVRKLGLLDLALIIVSVIILILYFYFRRV